MPPLLALLLTLADPVPCDVLIRGATVHPGDGTAPVVGDVAVRGDRIVAVGRFEATPKRAIDAAGLVVAPGFIDLHTHCDTGSPAITETRGRANSCYTRQGVTTVVTGNCGAGPWDVRAFLAKVDDGGAGTNVAHLVPHNSVRQKVMGNRDRAPTAEELAKMRALVAAGMRDGAWGLSTGLIYTPGTYSETAELVALAREAAALKGVYVSHIRDEGTGLLAAVAEAIRVGDEAGLPVHISHIKASGPRMFGKSADALALIDAARAAGRVVTADQYPYLASSTSLAAIVVPTRFRTGTPEEYRKRLADRDTGPAVRAAVEGYLGGRKGGESIQVARYGKRSTWQGKRLSQIADGEGKTATDIVMEIEANGGAGVVHFSMAEEDMRLYMRQPYVATASDGSTHLPGDTVPHPRSYGTFPRKVGRFAIEEERMPVAQAIRSASGLPADILGLRERGYLRPGHFADVVLLDPKTFRDTATFEKPHQYATGVRWLWVNGVAVIEDGKETGARGGRALRK